VLFRSLDIWFMLLFGVVGYVLKKLDYPLAPLVLSLVLGDRAEAAFRQTMMGSRGEMGVFWSNPLVGTITTLALIMLFWPALGFAWRRLRQLLGGDADGAAKIPG
jgi:putative tricarboxylic transport membrane protein